MTLPLHKVTNSRVTCIERTSLVDYLNLHLRAEDSYEERKNVGQKAKANEVPQLPFAGDKE